MNCEMANDSETKSSYPLWVAKILMCVGGAISF